MGIYTEYIDRNMSFQELCTERKEQLKRISLLRNNRDILVYASDFKKGNIAPILITYEDLVPFFDQLDNLKGNSIDIILETPGGYAEIVEDIVRHVRYKYEEVAFIIPGSAKSAGTIMVMSGDEILLEPTSSLGPIDAQLTWQGKVFSADAFLTGLDKIKQEVETSGKLNRAYIPILQSISPGDIQHAKNALDFAKKLVTNWLAEYKFRTWKIHSTTKMPVTDEDKEKRAYEIAEQLCSHSLWLTHNKSIKIPDLKTMRLKIIDYSTNTSLYDAIKRYYTLLHMTFETNIYKVFETINSQIYKYLIQQGIEQSLAQISPTTPAISPGIKFANIKITCNRCNHIMLVQCNFEKDVPLGKESIPYPSNDMLECQKCKASLNLADICRQIELQAKKEVVKQ